MLVALRICLAVLGVSAIAIALSILIAGAEFTAALAERAFSAVTGWSGPASGNWQPTMDSELRFYAALWGAYGIVVLRTARNLTKRLHETPWLAAVFFLGGIGRGLSVLSVGEPHPFFMLLMTVELVLPVVMIALWLGARMANRDAGPNSE